MTTPRTSPYMYVTWIPRYLTGEKSCLFAAWFKANHQGYAKMPSDFDSAKWNMEHTDLMNELVEELEERGCEIFIERQNSFKVESARSGVVVGGTPDIIAVHPDRTVAIYDAKTGRESASHIVQVQLYMYLLPKAADRSDGATRNSRAWSCTRTAASGASPRTAWTMPSSRGWLSSCGR